MRRHELTDEEWELLAPLVHRAATGRPHVEDRRVTNGMVHKIRKGISWRDLPDRYGPRKTRYTRFRRYAFDGALARALQHIQARADAAVDIDWLVQIDHMREALFARIPTADEVQFLQLPVGEPVVELHRTTYTADGTVVEFAVGIHSASRFAWEYDFQVPDSAQDKKGQE